MWSLYIVRWLTCQDSAKCCCVIHDDYKSFFSQSVQQHLAQIIILMILRDNSGVASSGCFLLIRESLIPPTPDTPVIPRYLDSGHWILVTSRGRGVVTSSPVWHTVTIACALSPVNIANCDSLFRWTRQYSLLKHHHQLSSVTLTVKCVYIGVRCPWVETRQHNTFQSTSWEPRDSNKTCYIKRAINKTWF